MQLRLLAPLVLLALASISGRSALAADFPEYDEYKTAVARQTWTHAIALVEKNRGVAAARALRARTDVSVYFDENTVAAMQAGVSFHGTVSIRLAGEPFGYAVVSCDGSAGHACRFGYAADENYRTSDGPSFVVYANPSVVAETAFTKDRVDAFHP